jgi:hypothetical protein
MVIVLAPPSGPANSLADALLDGGLEGRARGHQRHGTARLRFLAVAWPRITLAVFCAIGVTVSCGDDGGSGTTEPTDAAEPTALVDRLSSEALYLGTVDLAAVREELGLDPDAEVPTAESASDHRVLGRYYGLASVGLAYLRFSDDVGAAEAIDSGRVSEAASAEGLDGQVVVLRTDQPFEEIADGMEEEGYERDGDLLVSDDRFSTGGFRFVGSVDDVVILGVSAAAVDEALEAGAEPLASAAATMLAAVEGSARVGVAANADRELECGSSFGIGVSAEPAEGEFAAYADGDGDPDNVFAGLDDDPRFDAFGIEVTTAEAEGDLVRVTFHYEPAPAVTIRTPLELVLLDSPFGELYDC